MPICFCRGGHKSTNLPKETFFFNQLTVLCYVCNTGPLPMHGGKQWEQKTCLRPVGGKKNTFANNRKHTWWLEIFIFHVNYCVQTEAAHSFQLVMIRNTDVEWCFAASLSPVLTVWQIWGKVAAEYECSGRLFATGRWGSTERMKYSWDWGMLIILTQVCRCWNCGKCII